MFRKLVIISAIFSTCAQAEVFVGGYSFSEPTPKGNPTATSVTHNPVFMLPLKSNADHIEKKYYDKVTFIYGRPYQSLMTLYKPTVSMAVCKKTIDATYNYYKEKYANRGFKDAPIKRGYFAAAFDSSLVKFAQFRDQGKLYDITVGCLVKPVTKLTIYAQTEVD